MNQKTTKAVQFVYWFAYYNLDSPSVRYRGKYPLDYLKRHYHIDSYFVIPGYRVKNILNFLKAYCAALLFRKTNSLIVIQRIHSGFIYAGLLKLLIKIRPSQTFYDLDDADYLEYPPHTIFHFVKNCSGVFVGSRELAKNLAQYNSNMILNPSPTPDLQRSRTQKNSTLTIGWIGDFGGGHKEALLNLFFPALKQLNFELNLILVGVGRKNDSDFHFLEEYFSHLPHVRLVIPRNCNWNNESAVQNLICSFDLGIATLLDTEGHRSKSAFKLKQYLNNGVPVLSTDLPENNFFVQDGWNGFLCRTPHDFKRRIAEVHEMGNTDYMKLSTQARQSTGDFSLASYCTTLLTGSEQLNSKKYRSQVIGEARVTPMIKI